MTYAELDDLMFRDIPRPDERHIGLHYMLDNPSRRRSLEVSRAWGLIEKPIAEAIWDCIYHGMTPWPLVLTGPPGTGKTCAALCVLDLVRGYCYSQTLDGACKELIAAMKGEVPGAPSIDSEIAWWDRWKQAECTLLDEIGQRNPSDYTFEVVKRAIDARHGRPAIFVSNLPLAQLRNAYDERVFSRLNAGTAIEMAGRDRRVSP